MPIKVLHIINDLSRNGGAQRFVIDLVCPPPEGFQICVITLEDSNDFRDELDAVGVKCCVWQHLSLVQKWQWLRWPDVLHGHLFPSIYIALAALGKKRIQTEHATHNRRRDHRWIKPFEFFLYWRYHITVCITEEVKQALEDFLPHWKSHYQVILNGIDVNKFSLAQKEAPVAGSPIHIGMVGRFHHYKDQPTLIHALALLPNNYQLHLVGDGPRRQEYQALVEKLALGSRVTFHGIRADIPTFLDGLTVYVQSSVVEGFGLAPLEAMASGLPVLASRVQGMSEVIAKDSSLFRSGDAETLAAKITDLCHCSSQYHALSAYSLARCQHFSLPLFRQQYYQTYQHLLNKSTRLDESIP